MSAGCLDTQNLETTTEIQLESLEIAPNSAIRDMSEIQLPSGRTVDVTETANTERLTVRGAGGHVELQIELTEHGPRLRFESADIDFQNAGRVRFDCQSFEVNARDHIEQTSGGTLTLSAHADMQFSAQADLISSARETKIESTRGDVFLSANDFVRLDGEVIRLNC